MAPRRRASVLLAGVLAAVAGLAARLVYVQALRADEYTEIAERQRVRTLVLPAVRGAIYDRHGRELALSVPARTVFANPRQVEDRDGTARVLAPILGRPVAELERKLSQDRGFVYLARRVDLDAARRVEALRLPGVGTLEEARRSYPGGRLAAQVVGFVGTDGVGLGGLEHGYDELLRGRPGLRVIEQDPRGRPIPQARTRERLPVPGADLVLTLDCDVQYAAERALARQVEATGARGGSVVVMRPRTGEILAMANEPSFNPGDLRGLAPEATRNRAVTDAYEPGSANKVVTAAAALEEGLVSPTTVFSVPATITVAGRRFKDAHGHATKTMTFEDIIAESSNVGTIKVALRLGPAKLTEYLRRFGYGRSTGLGFPGESAGILPRADRWKTSLPTMAIGQGLSVTVLQIVRVFATVANDGVAVEPRLVAGWVDAGGQYHPAPPSRSARVISAATAATLRRMLTKVVTSGTGTLAAVPGYETAGKTGTAQKPAPGGYRGHVASFVGMVPAASPELVVGVVLDDPTPIWGGVVAAPVFREVAGAALRILRVPPTGPAAPSPQPPRAAVADDNDAAAGDGPAPAPGARVGGR